MPRTNYQLKERFCDICKELDVDPKALLQMFPSHIPAIVSEWAIAKINDVQLMRQINSLAKCNPDVLLEFFVEDGDR